MREAGTGKSAGRAGGGKMKDGCRVRVMWARRRRARKTADAEVVGDEGAGLLDYAVVGYGNDRGKAVWFEEGEGRWEDRVSRSEGTHDGYSNEIIGDAEVCGCKGRVEVTLGGRGAGMWNDVSRCANLPLTNQISCSLGSQ